MALDIMPIPLSQGLFALVDGKNYKQVSQHKWSAAKLGKTFYAVRGCNPLVYMHREILQVPKRMRTDHINHCGLDNREVNIRICTRNQNQHNRQNQEGSSRYKGVYWQKQSRKWRAQIVYNNRKIHLGLFTDETEAAEAYNTKARELFGEFVYPNIILGE